MKKVRKLGFGAFVISTTLAIGLVSITRAEFVWQGISTRYNQGRKIVLNPANGFLHVVFNAADIAYSWSEDGGNTWLPDNEFHREWIPFPYIFGTYGEAIALDPDGKPWVSGVHPGGIENPTNTLQGGVKVDGVWHTGVLMGRISFDTFAVMGYSATAASKYPDPEHLFTAYTVVPVHKYIPTPPPGNWGPSFWHSLFLVAWGIDADGFVTPYSSYELDCQYLPGVYVPFHRASVAVERDPEGQGDIVHVVWQRKDPNSRIYHVQSEPITPAQVRSGQRIQWEDWFRVSTDYSEPADYPSVDFWNNPPYPPYLCGLAVAWHGPDINGAFPGEVWRRRKFLGQAEWEINPQCISQGASQEPTESRYPEPSGLFVVVWQEEVDGGDIYARFGNEIVRIVQRAGPDQYPHIAAWHRTDRDITYCHTLWTREAEGEIHYLCYVYEYIPRMLRGGEQSSKLVRISENDVWLEPVTPVVPPSGAKLRYFLPKDTRVEINIFDLTGRKVRQLLTANQSRGYHECTWEGKTGNGQNVSAGSYIWVLRTPTTVKSQPVLVLK